MVKKGKIKHPIYTAWGFLFFLFLLVMLFLWMIKGVFTEGFG